MINVDFRSATSMAMRFCATMLFLGMMSAIQAATQYNYVATTKAKVAAEQGPVKAGSLTWQCKGNQCRNSGPRPTPGVDACKALAQKVGQIASYGYKGKLLSKEQLATCNKSIRAVQNPTASVTQSTSEASATLRKRSSEALGDKSPDSTSKAVPETDLGDVQNPAISTKLSEVRKVQANEDLRFLQARDRLREGNVIIDGGSIFVYIR